MLAVEGSQAVVAMLNPLEPSASDLATPSDWSVYDDTCWFRLVGGSGFDGNHVSALICVLLTKSLYCCV